MEAEGRLLELGEVTGVLNLTCSFPSWIEDEATALSYECCSEAVQMVMGFLIGATCEKKQRSPTANHFRWRGRRKIASWRGMGLSMYRTCARTRLEDHILSRTFAHYPLHSNLTSTCNRERRMQRGVDSIGPNTKIA